MLILWTRAHEQLNQEQVLNTSSSATPSLQGLYCWDISLEGKKQLIKNSSYIAWQAMACKKELVRVLHHTQPHPMSHAMIVTMPRRHNSNCHPSGLNCDYWNAVTAPGAPNEAQRKGSQPNVRAETRW